MSAVAAHEELEVIELGFDLKPSLYLVPEEEVTPRGYSQESDPPSRPSPFIRKTAQSSGLSDDAGGLRLVTLHEEDLSPSLVSYPYVVGHMANHYPRHIPTTQEREDVEEDAIELKEEVKDRDKTTPRGKYVRGIERKKVEGEETLRAIEATVLFNPGGIAKREIAEKVGKSTRTVERQLKVLVEEEKIRGELSPGKETLYFHTGNPSAYLTGLQRALKEFWRQENARATQSLGDLVFCTKCKNAEAVEADDDLRLCPWCREEA